MYVRTYVCAYEKRGLQKYIYSGIKRYILLGAATARRGSVFLYKRLKKIAIIETFSKTLLRERKKETKCFGASFLSRSFDYLQPGQVGFSDMYDTNKGQE